MSVHNDWHFSSIILYDHIDFLPGILAVNTKAALIVLNAPPYKPGRALLLREGITLLGRAWEDHKPDISFKDSRISRQHAKIIYENDIYILLDLPASKHGTELNGEPLVKGKHYELKHNDEISLAKGTVELRFCCQIDAGQTLEFSEPAGEPSPNDTYEDTHDLITVDSDRREVIIGGVERRPRIVSREFELICLLYENRGKAVSHDEIIGRVWNDVQVQDTITRQDVNTLVHRLRKSLGEYGKYIENIPSYGYRLD